MEKENYRKSELRSSYSDDFIDILRENFPKLMAGDVDDYAVREMHRCFSSGIPFDYLEADWEDYQADERKALTTVRKFAATIPYQVHTGGGLAIIGNPGAGKSFLSYLCALEAIKRWKMPTVCFTVREYLDKKAHQYVNPLLFSELLEKIDQARFVVLDNLCKESDKVGWKPEDLFEIVDRVVGGKRKKSMVLNTNMSGAEYKAHTSVSVLSRISSFQHVMLSNKDFRGTRPDYEQIIKWRKRKRQNVKCYKPMSIVPSDYYGTGPIRPSTPEACRSCAYSTRPVLCDLRNRVGKWKRLEKLELGE